MRNHNWNKPVLGAALFAVATLACAQAPGASAPAVVPAADTLFDALTCRVSRDRYATLMEQLRAERPQDFTQTYRQYDDPMMDEYRLLAPVHALGHESDTIVVASNRVMMAVAGPLVDATARLEHALAKESPLSGALDKRHGLVIYAPKQPGLKGMVLLGCEYRIPKISLLGTPYLKPPGKRADPAP